MDIRGEEHPRIIPNGCSFTQGQRCIVINETFDNTTNAWLGAGRGKSASIPDPCKHQPIF